MAAGGVSVIRGEEKGGKPWRPVIPMSPDLISIPEAARRLGIHADTLYRLSRTGRFPPAIQIGRRWRVSVPRLERFLHQQDAASTANR